ncbi:MAG: ATP-binding protein [Puniceicoccaceae bacterium]
MTKRGTSWQWQLVLIIVLVSGIALASFIGVLSQLVRISNYNKLDAELVAVSLKYGWAFMAGGIDPARRIEVDREAYAAGTTFAETGFAFYHLQRESLRTDELWPTELDPKQLGNSVPEIYKQQGKPLADSRFFELQRRIAGGRRGPDAPSPEEVRELTRQFRRQSLEGDPIQPPQGAPPDNRPDRAPDFRPGGRGGPRTNLPSLDQAVFSTVRRDGKRFRVMGYTNGNGVFMAAQDLVHLEDSMQELRRSIILALPVALALIGLVAWYVAGRAIGPVKRLSDSAAGITAEGLGNRLEPGKEPPEFAKLIDVYNQMLDRLDISFHQARRFSADAAHELNTPLTVLQGHLDILLQSSEEGSEAQEQLAMLCEEVRGLQEVIRKLLVLSQADAGKLTIEPTQVDLSTLVSEILEDVEIMAPELEFSGKIEPGIEIKGDRSLLRQTFFNLLTNATKYNREDGFVRIELSRKDSKIRLDVVNAGYEIPAEKADKLFDRFFRVDDSRNSKIEGKGLGLSLAWEFVRAHRGTIQLVCREQDKITFRVELPA